MFAASPVYLICTTHTHPYIHTHPHVATRAGCEGPLGRPIPLQNRSLLRLKSHTILRMNAQILGKRKYTCAIKDTIDHIKPSVRIARCMPYTQEYCTDKSTQWLIATRHAHPVSVRIIQSHSACVDMSNLTPTHIATNSHTHTHTHTHPLMIPRGQIVRSH